MIRALWHVCRRYNISLWVERVGSTPNIADGPSRSDFGEAERLGFRRIDVADWYTARDLTSGTDLEGLWPRALSDGAALKNKNKKPRRQKKKSKTVRKERVSR